MNIWERYAGIIHGTTAPVVVEIGAADGEDTARLQDPLIHTGRDWRLLAFECERKNFEKFRRRNLTAVEFFELAVSDKNGPANFIGSGSWPYSGSLKEPVNHRISHAWIPFQPPVEVMCTTLDSVFESCRLHEITFIWMDVQGAEDLVVAGGQKALSKTRWIWCEIYEAEEYQGHIGREEFLRRLPGKWEIVEVQGTDVLFHNLDFP